MADHSDRDRIRSLVRNVLAQAIPDVDQSSGDAQAASQFIDTVPKSSAPDVFTRDESSKLVITEDDVRGLEQGAVLRIGELARLTPLANDGNGAIQLAENPAIKLASFGRWPKALAFGQRGAGELPTIVGQ